MDSYFKVAGIQDLNFKWVGFGIPIMFSGAPGRKPLDFVMKWAFSCVTGSSLFHRLSFSLLKGVLKGLVIAIFGDNWLMTLLFTNCKADCYMKRQYFFVPPNRSLFEILIRTSLNMKPICREFNSLLSAFTLTGAPQKECGPCIERSFKGQTSHHI